MRQLIPELVKFHGETTKRHYGRQVESRRSFEEAAADHPAIFDAWWAYLDEQLLLVENGGVPDAEVGLANLRKSVGAKSAEQFPELTKRVDKIDLAKSLHRTLNAGVFDEYGWDALDQAVAEVKLPPNKRYGAADQYWIYPQLGYYRHNTLVIVKPDGFSAMVERGERFPHGGFRVLFFPSDCFDRRRRRIVLRQTRGESRRQVDSRGRSFSSRRFAILGYQGATTAPPGRR